MTSEVVRYEIKNFITWTSTWKIGLKNPGRSVSTNTNTNWSWFLVDPVDDEDWRDRPRTDPSSVSDLGTGLGVILVLKRLDSAQLSCRDFFQLRDSQFQLDQLIETP